MENAPSTDRVLFFDGGRIVEQGPPDAIFRDPKEERTKLFLKKILAAVQRLYGRRTTQGRNAMKRTFKTSIAAVAALQQTWENLCEGPN